MRFLGRDGGVAVDNLCGNAAHGLDTEGKRSYVKEKKSLYVAAKYAALNCGAYSYTFVGVDTLERLLADKVLNGFLNGRNTGRAAYHKHLIDVAGGKSAVGKSLTNGAHCLFYEVGGKLVKLSSCKSGFKVFRAGSVGGNERKVDVGCGHAGKVNFCLFCGFLNALHGHFVVFKVNSAFSLKGCADKVHYSLVKVVAAKTVVTGGSKNFLNAVTHFDYRNVEGAAAKVVYHNLLVVFLVNAVSKSGCGRLVNNTFNVKTGDTSGVLSSLTLSVGKVSGNGNNGLGYRRADVSLGVGLKLLQNDCGNFLRSVVLTVNAYFVSGTHFTLDGSDCTVGVGDSLTLCNLAYKTLACF